MADYNLDGSTDLAWHASGSDAPSEELGRVQLWLSTAEGTFDTVLLETGGGSPLVLDPSVFTLNGR